MAIFDISHCFEYKPSPVLLNTTEIDFERGHGSFYVAGETLHFTENTNRAQLLEFKKHVLCRIKDAEIRNEISAHFDDILSQGGFMFLLDEALRKGLKKVEGLPSIKNLFLNIIPDGQKIYIEIRLDLNDICCTSNPIPEGNPDIIASICARLCLIINDDDEFDAKPEFVLLKTENPHFKAGLSDCPRWRLDEVLNFFLRLFGQHSIRHIEIEGIKKDPYAFQVILSETDEPPSATQIPSVDETSEQNDTNTNSQSPRSQVCDAGKFA
ncbi:hypothetical protein FNU76_11435 [Chitinimonas arctica]|uniref:Uncharacterized protein n=1 Tax=Chitinimonas arctica TaxID=2594795 RepID=A0A516SFI9_9NEIS|nr:hypothetical protein [Chitinimonas arctica]QDQ26924.1 hypothetical protein FNU76_11435 [Chitinimonas arctica]